MSATATPDALVVRPHSIPSVLRERRQWVAWCWAWRDSMNGTANKWTKVPIDVRTGRHAQSDNPDTWADFDTARAYAETRTNIAGIGYVFSADDPFAGIDFDHCREEETGELDSWAAAVLAGFDSYAEVSPSGTGVKCIVRATLPGGGIRRQRPDGIPGGMVEMYDRGRFFTLTGHHVQTTPATIHDAQEAAKTLYDRLTQRQESTKGGTGNEQYNGHHTGQAQRDALTDDGLIAAARGAKNGAKFTTLWKGDTSAYPSQSEADLALCSLLAFYTGPDMARIDRLFRRSLLMRPKWDERHGAETYGALTVQAAIDRRTEYRQPGDRDATRRDGPEIHLVISNYEDGEPWTPPSAPWPEPLAEEAYHGIVGEIVHTIEPHTEADAAAVLGQFHIATGVCIGPSPHFMAEADKHRLNLFGAFAGESSKGRKGTSWGHVRRIYEQIDPEWTATRILDGLSSGEGLIQQVRDPLHDKDGVITEPGAQDKRLLVQAPEFANVLQVQGRDGSTLSGHLRNAWDGRSLRTLTRTPLVATAPHIGLIGHITRDELLRLFDDTSAANGYGNRFLWFAVRRSKLLPLGGRLRDTDLAPLIARLSQAVAYARTVGEIERDAAATEMWCEVYPTLSADRPGLLGAMTARAEPQVMRLACIYALLDMSRVIRKEHLLAALAVWAYCDQSAQWIFGDWLGDPVADEVLRALRTAGDAGLTRTDISALFSNNRQANRITTALQALEARNLARCVRERPEGGMGRTIERWYARGT